MRTVCKFKFKKVRIEEAWNKPKIRTTSPLMKGTCGFKRKRRAWRSSNSNRENKLKNCSCSKANSLIKQVSIISCKQVARDYKWALVVRLRGRESAHLGRRAQPERVEIKLSEVVQAVAGVSLLVDGRRVQDKKNTHKSLFMTQLVYQ